MNMPNKRLNIALFSSKSECTKEYKELLRNFDVRVVEIGSEKFCKVALESIKCNGILLDIPAYMKSSPQTKEFMTNLEKIYPTARVRYNKDTRNAEVIVLEERKQITLHEFLEKHCRSFKARKLRTNGRTVVNLSVRLFLEKSSREIRCTTSNISQGGLFLVHYTDDLLLGSKVRMQILELGKHNFMVLLN
jgi:hypothetical protein